VAAEQSETLQWALRALRETDRQQAYRNARSFYDTGKPTGGKLERLGTRKFREIFGAVFDVSDNLCAAVVDSIADRLKVTGVNPGDTGSAVLADAAWVIWTRNRMDVRAPETHHEALLAGDGYALVWPDQEGQAVIWSLPACDVAVSYDPNRPGLIRRAARFWWDDDTGRAHVDVYTPDRVERWASKASRKSDSGLGNPNHFEPYAAVNAGGVQIDAVLDNQWGRVPIVHFPNLRHHGYGVSELSNVVPLQRALNKTLCDLLVAQEFSAFRQRYATGFDVEDGDSADAAEPGTDTRPPLDYGNDRMITSTDPETRFGSFDASDLTQYVEVLENFRAEIARVSGTPLHYLFITRGDFPSGEAMKSAEARFTRKVENRQAAFGNQWEDLLALALRMEGADAGADGSMLSLEWEPAEPTGLTTPPVSGPTNADGERDTEPAPIGADA
jgi:hypothetical protein